MNNLVFGNAERKPAVLPAPAMVAVAAVVISWQTTVKGLFMEEKCPNCRERKQVKIEDEDEDEDHKKEKEQKCWAKVNNKSHLGPCSIKRFFNKLFGVGRTKY